LLTTASGPTLIGRGQTLQGKTDKFNASTGTKFAFTRALKDAFPNPGQEGTRSMFRVQYLLTHKTSEQLPDTPQFLGYSTQEKNGLYPWQRRVIAAISNPSGGSSHFRDMYLHRRHEYGQGGPVGKDIGLSPKFDAAHEIVWPVIDYRAAELRVFAAMAKEKAQREKNERLRKLYTPRAQVEDRCHRVGDPNVTIINVASLDETMKRLLSNKNAIAKAILNKEDDKRQKLRGWLEGVWEMSDDNLSARMLSMSLHAEDEHKKLQAALELRHGITRFQDEYMVDSDKFVPAFEVGEIVTHEGVTCKVLSVQNMFLRLQPVLRAFGKDIVKNGKSLTAFEWEVEKKESWIKRAETWVRVALANCPRTGPV
jgi:hypothetical protein